MFNLDVFNYPVGSPGGLYGAIPYLISLGQAGPSVGLLWLNASETWVDVSNSTPGLLESLAWGEIPQTESHWISESGVIDVHILLGPTPKDLFRQYSRLTGTTDLPPLFSLGYHQCRWNYDSEEDVQGVDEGFDTHDIPYDVLWLDIEHTNQKKYFTWDPVHFPTPLAMQAKLAEKSRKVLNPLSFFLSVPFFFELLALDGDHCGSTHQKRDWVQNLRRGPGTGAVCEDRIRI